MFNDLKAKIMDFREEDLESKVASSSCLLFSKEEMDFLGETGPIYVGWINTINRLNYWLYLNNIPLQVRALTSYVLESLDSYVLMKNISTGLLKSKVSLLKQLERYAALSIREATPYFDLTTDDLTWVAAKIKIGAMRLIKHLGGEAKNTRGLSLTKSPPDLRALQRRLGRNLKSVVLYNLQLTNKRLKDVAIFVRRFNTDVYISLKGAIATLKPLNPRKVIVLPYEPEFLSTYSSASYVLYPMLKTGIVVMGEPVELPEVDEETYINLCYVRSSQWVMTLRTALAIPERVESMVSHRRYLYTTLSLEPRICHALRQVEESRAIDFQEFYRMEPWQKLARDAVVDKPTVERLLVEANYRVKERIKRHMQLISG